MTTSNQGNIFQFPFQYWVGMETDPRTTPEALAEFNRFYSTTHVGEVIAAHPGFVTSARYELVEGSGPRWLAMYGMADEAAAERYIKDNERPWLHRRKYSPWPAARKKAKTVWRLLWKQIHSSDSVPETIVLVGTNTPPSDETLALFELYRAFAHPVPGSPGFYAVYPSDGAAELDAVWRLKYRYIHPPG